MRSVLTKNIQLLTTPCTRHAFRWDTLDVHDSPDPFSRVLEGGWARDYFQNALMRGVAKNFVHALRARLAQHLPSSNPGHAPGLHGVKPPSMQPLLSSLDSN